MKASLGNVDPTDEERQRLLAVLNGLSQRVNARRGGEFGAAIFNAEDGTAELRWDSGGRVWIVAWILGPERDLLVWRHPSYRDERDDAWLHEHSTEVRR